jgi:hypothetical protein
MSKRRDETWNRLAEQHIACCLFAPDEKAVLDAIDPGEFYKVELTDMPTPASRRRWVDGGPCPFCQETATTKTSIHNERKGHSFRLDLNTGAFYCFDCHIRGKDILDFVVCRDREFFLDQRLPDNPGSEFTTKEEKRKYALLWLAETWEV